MAPEGEVRRSLLDGLDITQKRLHNHFYTGQLSEGDLDRHLIIGAAFVEQLQTIASQLGEHP